MRAPARTLGLALLLATTCGATGAWASDRQKRAADDFVQTPAPEQATNTPLPVYVEATSDDVARVIVKYEGPTMNEWVRLEMKRMGRGWGALIPCGAMTTGTMRYWIQGFDAGGDAVASSGDPRHPFEVPVREAITSEPPRLPGRAAPRACAGGQEAPLPSVPTPPTAASERAPVAAAPPIPPGPGTFARWWIGVSGAIDFTTLPAGNDVCALGPSGAPANASGYYCTTPTGADFPANGAENATIAPGQSGQASGGLRAGNLRALFAFDYAFTPNVLVGGRLGYVFNAYPSSGAAVAARHAFGSGIELEARGTYVFGDDALSHGGFAPVVFGALGLAEFDAHTSVTATKALPYTYVDSSGNNQTITVAVNQPAVAWRTSGPWFVGVGGGFRYQFSQRAAFTGAIRLNAAFGGATMVTYGPEIAFQYGF
jgi:hypothetical protein